MKWLGPALALLLVAPAAAASDLNLPPGMSAPVEGDSVTFAFVGKGAGGLSTEAAIAAVRHGVSEWDQVACSRLSVRMAEPVDSLDQLPEDTVPILFVGTDDPCFPARDTGDQPIGFTVVCPSYPAPSILLNGESYTWSNAPFPFQSIDGAEGSPAVVDASSVIVHEMGHALSLPHVDDPIATMYARYRRDGSQATLAAADDLALCEIFAGGTSECEADEECPDGECVEGERFGVCDAYRGATGDFCSWSELSCSEQCFFSSPATGTGYCSETCSSDDSCPDRMVCEEASNGLALCQFAFGAAESSGCGTAAGGGPGGGALVLLVSALGLVISRRTRSR